MDTVVILREHKCKITPIAFSEALRIAHVHVVRYAIENGIKWDPIDVQHKLNMMIYEHADAFPGHWHAARVREGKTHPRFEEDLEWINARCIKYKTTRRLRSARPNEPGRRNHSTRHELLCTSL